MSQFRSKRLDLSGFINSRIVRDHTKRKVYEQYEPDRQALRYIIRNTTLPQRARAQAQLQLSQMHAYTRPTQIKNRCTSGGIARSVFRDFRIARYQFRQQALAGELPGVKKPDHLHRSKMFVFRPKDLPPDAVFPADLKGLGYFINDNDQIKKVSDPEQEFQFKINKNPRWNEAQREAMNNCIRSIVTTRLQNQGMTALRLPLTSGLNEPHVSILVSANLSAASRIIVVFGEPTQDLGIWAYRSVGMDGINAGSAVSLAEHVLKTQQPSNNSNGKRYHQFSDTALILANTGQLIWHCAGRRAITQASWLALPRRSAVDPPKSMTGRNKVPGNENWQDHVECVFEEVLAARGRLVREDARIDVIGVSEGGLGAVRYLASDCSSPSPVIFRDSWCPYISTMCLCNPLHFTQVDLVDLQNDNDDTNPTTSNFLSFLRSRSRAYLISPEPRGVPVAGISDHGCNCFSSGEALNIEGVMPAAWREIVKWLEAVHADPGYCEDIVEVRTDDGDEEGVEAGVKVVGV